MGLNSAESDHPRLYETLLKTRLSWEVKCVSGSRIVTCCKRSLLPDACLPIGRLVHCSATVPCPPLHSQLEWVFVSSSDVTIGSRILSSKTNRSSSNSYQVEGGIQIDSSHLIISLSIPNPKNTFSPEEIILDGLLSIILVILFMILFNRIPSIVTVTFHYRPIILLFLRTLLHFVTYEFVIAIPSPLQVSLHILLPVSLLRY